MSERLESADLDHVDRLCAAITPGEWAIWDGYRMVRDTFDGQVEVYAASRIGPSDPIGTAGITAADPDSDLQGAKADLELAASAPTLLPPMAAELRDLREVARRVLAYDRRDDWGTWARVGEAVTTYQERWGTEHLATRQQEHR